MASARSDHILLRYGIQPGDPSQAGWGVIFAPETSPEVRRRLAPLLERRKEQAGDLYRELEQRPGEGLDEFLGRIGAGIGRVCPERLPYYLLLVGRPDEIPFGLQFDLAAQYAVGRIGFDDAASYGRYARSVVEHETRTTGPRPGFDLYSFDQPQEYDTQQALKGLARPLARQLGRGPAADHGESEPGHVLRYEEGASATHERLAESIAQGPSIVFTVGNSYLIECDVPGQAEWQGSLITGSWQDGPIRARHVYRAADVPAEADLRGRIFFLYGCHTVGTPEYDSFEPCRPRRRRLARRPFLAPLAQRLLAPPSGGGALAVIGQVDRARPHTSLRWNDVPQVDTFVDALRALGDGVPVGHALEGFGQRYADIAVHLVSGIQPEAGQPPGDLVWTAYHDARGIALLGDPLVAIRPDPLPSGAYRNVDSHRPPGYSPRSQHVEAALRLSAP